MPGPFIAPHLYVQWGGTLPGNDIWSCGLRMSPINSGTVDSAASMLDGVSAAISAFHAGTTGMQIDSRAILNHVKVNAIGTDGKYMLPTTNEKVLANVPGGISTSTGFPNQIALAITLATAVSRGPAHKGRFYVPLPAYTVGSDGRIGKTYSDNAKAAANTLITALNAVNANMKVAVYSRKIGAPAQRLVTGALVGRVLDTQRRRRNALVEDYS